MENNKIKKDVFGKTAFTARVLVVGMVFSATAFFIALDAFKEYKSSVSILVIPKNQVAAVQINDVVANISGFPKMLSFYERLLKFNPDIKDRFIGKDSDKKKASWNRIVEVSEMEAGGGAIMLAVYSKTSAQSTLLLKKTTNTLFDVTSNFYDIKSDFEMTVVDGPFTVAVLRGKVVWVAFSAMIGFAMSLALNMLLAFSDKKYFFSKYAFKKSPLTELKKRYSGTVKKKEFPIGDVEISQDIPYYFEIKDADEDYSGVDFSEDYGNYSKNASAPDNLPIADDSFSFEAPKADEAGQKETENFIELKKEEPTEEEIRERLNKLLRGEM